MPNCFVPADILLPKESVPLDPWACIAVDQFTSNPDYWQKAEELARDQPSTLHLVLPEAYLGTPQEEAHLAEIRAAMADYRKNILTRRIHGYVYLERTQQDGSVRQGLVGAVDLEQYSYEPGSRTAIRPSESTVVSRIPPRLKIRRGAELETPHVMMLADDEGCTLVEPIARYKTSLPLLYDGELMLGGGRLTGWAVEDRVLIEAIHRAVMRLSNADAFAARWPAAAGQRAMTLAVGDGNHSLATAKAYWEELKQTLTPEQKAVHPARWCLAEVCNVHSPAIQMEPIHRVLFDTTAAEVGAAFRYWLAAHGEAPQGGSQHIVLAGGRQDVVFDIRWPSDPLAVGTAEHFIGDYLAAHPGVTVDYIHGEAAARALAADASRPAAALLMPEFAKADLFKGVVLGGVLPRKTFSMGHAEEKRYYNECRSLVAPDKG